MHGHHRHWERHARRGWGGDDMRHGGHRGWGRHGHGGGRFFEQGDLRFVILALLKEKPRHGYDLIKEIEQRLGGAYAPSPGVVYPLLTMLEEMGHVDLVASEGPKKLYAITPEGEAELAQNEKLVSALFEKIDAVRDRFSGGRSPQVMRAMENLRYALRLRFESGPLTDEQAQAVAAALDAAAQAIERA
ncbi:MAG: PadR family transcriptional regulator [Pseudomonadota bacterium]